MPSNKKFIYGEHLIKRWGISVQLFAKILEAGFPRYDDNNNPVEYDGEDLGDWDFHRYFIEDIERYEDEHPEMFESVSFDEKEHIDAKEKRELGQLRREKEKWDASMKVAVRIGIFCREQDRELNWAEVYDKAQTIDSSLPEKTIRQVWNAIPPQYRSKGGYPKGKKRK